MEQQIQAAQTLYWSVINLLKSCSRIKVTSESLNCTTLHKAFWERVPEKL